MDHRFLVDLTVTPDPDKAEWVIRENFPGGKTYRKSWWRGYFHLFKRSVQGYNIEVLD